MLFAIRVAAPNCRFYYGASTDVLSNLCETRQAECTRFDPPPAYNTSKVAGYDLTPHKREEYGLYARELASSSTTSRQGVAPSS